MGLLIKQEKKMTNVVPPNEKMSPEMTSPGEYQPSGPTLYVQVDVPAITSKKVGDEFTVTGKVRLKGMDIRRTRKGDKTSFDLEFLELGVG